MRVLRVSLFALGGFLPRALKSPASVAAGEGFLSVVPEIKW
jgi:hypothetical protein